MRDVQQRLYSLLAEQEQPSPPCLDPMPRRPDHTPPTPRPLAHAPTTSRLSRPPRARARPTDPPPPLPQALLADTRLLATALDCLDHLCRQRSALLAPRIASFFCRRVDPRCCSAHPRAREDPPTSCLPPHSSRIVCTRSPRIPARRQRALHDPVVTPPAPRTRAPGSSTPPPPCLTRTPSPSSPPPRGCSSRALASRRCSTGQTAPARRSRRRVPTSVRTSTLRAPSTRRRGSSPCSTGTTTPSWRSSRSDSQPQSRSRPPSADRRRCG